MTEPGLQLNEFVQTLIVSITGLAGNLVRPAFQTEPPTLVDNGTAWASFRFTGRQADTFPQITHDGAADVDNLHRHETLNVLVSFYDLGTNGQADRFASLLRDGLAIPANVEQFPRNGMGFISCGDLAQVPVLIKQLWVYRVDLPFSFRREVIRGYSTNNIDTAQFAVST